MSASPDHVTDRSGAVAVLAGLPSMGPRRLRLVLMHHEPGDALDRLASGRPLHQMVQRCGDPATLAALRDQARSASVDRARTACERHGVRVLLHGDDLYPEPLRLDPQAPAALFAVGDLDALAARRAGIVGTRNATAAGIATAHELGHDLAELGVSVVSGLARGIDGAAHRGARAADGPGRAVAVVANGADVAYPKVHRDLWSWVCADGLLLSEWPPGVTPDPWKFPLRNRILAALCEVLVVVESRERGGSLITARHAIDRDVEVMVVPGSPRSRASEGTNQLLVDGATPVTSVADVAGMLGLDHRRAGRSPYDGRPPLTEAETAALEACGPEPATLGMVSDLVGQPLIDVALTLARLEQQGRLVESGGWFEPAGSRLEPG